MAGYSEEIDWLEGSTLDLYFWTTYYKSNQAGGELKCIERVAARMAPVHGLCVELGFDIFIRRKGSGGGLKSLLNDSKAP